MYKFFARYYGVSHIPLVQYFIRLEHVGVIVPAGVGYCRPESRVRPCVNIAHFRPGTNTKYSQIGHEFPEYFGGYSPRISRSRAVEVGHVVTMFLLLQSTGVERDSSTSIKPVLVRVFCAAARLVYLSTASVILLNNVVVAFDQLSTRTSQGEDNRSVRLSGQVLRRAQTAEGNPGRAGPGDG